MATWSLSRSVYAKKCEIVKANIVSISSAKEPNQGWHKEEASKKTE